MEISENNAQEAWDKINAVDRMQAYVVSHIREEITMQELSNAAGYSRWHSLRIFKELLGMTPFEFIRAVKLTKAAEMLRDTPKSVIDVAMEVGFDSHDGFTRAFKRQFGITPTRYKDETPAIAYFGFTPIKYYYLYVKNRRDAEMEKEKVSKIVTTYVVERPARKLVLLRSKTARCYDTFCEEMGCNWHALLGSIPEKFTSGALLTFPPGLMKAGTGIAAAGVEVPHNYAKPLPEGYEIINLPPCKMMFFQGAPFENEGDYGEAIGTIFKAIKAYNPELYGYKYAPNIAPHFNFGASAEGGAIMAIPVESIK